MPRRKGESAEKPYYDRRQVLNRRKQKIQLRQDVSHNSVVDYIASTYKQSVSRRKQQIQTRGEPMDYEIVQIGAHKPLVEWKLVKNMDKTWSQHYRRTEYWTVFEVRHNFQSLPDLMEFQTSIDNAYAEAMRPFRERLNPNDMIGGYIENQAFTKDIYLRPQANKDFDPKRFLNRVFETSHSNASFLHDGLIKVRVVTYDSLTGRGRGSRAPKSHAETDSKKKSIIGIRNTDNSCGYRAIAVGIKWHEWNVKDNSQQRCWKHLTERETAQESELHEFCYRFDLDFRTPVNISILQEIDRKVIDYQIIVIQNCSQVFQGTDRTNVIYLLYDGHHYDLITSMKGYLHRQFYCKYCNKGYQKSKDHRCDNSCYLCRAPKECIRSVREVCMVCNVTFRSKQCYDNHLKTQICKDRHFCWDCETMYTVGKKDHECGVFTCKDCGEYYKKQPHYCHIRILPWKRIEEQDAKSNVFIAYDIECMLERNGEVFNHIPILVISKMFCSVCAKTGVCDLCFSYEPQYKEFSGENCIQEFIQYLLDYSKFAETKKAYVSVFAHNNSGYDGHWILRELIRRNIKGLDPTLNGTKIMKLDAGNIRFLDTLLLFHRPLADLPKMFGLEGEAKGFFPHFANTKENQGMVQILGDIPVEDFGRSGMKENRVRDFDHWYAENCDMIYDLNEQMKTYCLSDVTILLESLKRFRQLFIETTEIDPLARCFTLASIGMEFFRAKVLPEVAKLNEVMGITPIGGYNNYRKQSLSANAWLDLMEIKYKRPMIRECKIGKYFADGYMDFPTNAPIDIGPYSYFQVAFEYNGCPFHGHYCGNNYDQRLLDKLNNKKDYYNRRGIGCISVWDCEVDKNQAFKERLAYYKEISTGLHCDPRKSLHGGRTNNLKFGYKVSGNEELKYLDFTSLYPYILSRRFFPSSHPEVVRQNFPPIEQMVGFVSCKILPPKRLYLPLLPYSCNGKLTFPLCRTCAETQNQFSCYHSDEERSLIGTFVSVELRKALELGYTVVKIYEMLEYENSFKGLFTKYIDIWYKIKTEASGFPSDCQTEEQKQQFIQDFKEKEKIDLEYEKIKPNPGLRTTAKLMLNSFWGKLAQRPNLPTTKIIKEYEEMWNILNDKEIEVLGEVLIEDMMLVSYKYENVEKARVGQTSVAIASFVTAFARLKLYKELEKIEASSPGSVLYFDTDSIIFVQKPGCYSPTIGNFLGEMTDEITSEFGAESKMTEFYTTGPKTYAYKIETPNGPQFKFKAKGITQNIGSLEMCNFETIKRMAENKVSDISNSDVMVPQTQFRCNSRHVVTTHNLNKRFNVTSDKRRIVGNDTLPYGWVDSDIEDFAEMMTE